MLFLGEYDDFAFFDSDIAVLMDYEDLFEAFQNAPYDLVYFDTDLLVFKLPFARKMMAEYNAFGFNSGAFLSRKTAITEDQILAAVVTGEKIRDDFAIWGEQPFINYLFQVSRCRLTHANALAPELTFKTKSWIPSHYDATTGHLVDVESGRFPFFHWANEEYPTMRKPEIFLQYRTSGMAPTEKRSYLWQFYYRRLRAKSKAFLRQAGIFGTLLEKRDIRLGEKQKKAMLATQQPR